SSTLLVGHSEDSLSDNIEVDVLNGRKYCFENTSPEGFEVSISPEFNESENEDEIEESTSRNEVDPISSSNESDSEAVDESFSNYLTDWAVKYKISHTALSDLLRNLQNHKCFTDLPRDSRTLLKTPQTTIVESVPPGNYVHFGLRQALTQLLGKANINPVELQQMSIQIGIDGLPVQRSNTNQFWPLLLHCSKPRTSVEPIGIYYGKTKPNCINDFLKKNIEDLKVILIDGIEFNGVSLQIKFQGFICDAPARSFVTATKGHTGYSGCSRCYDAGIWRSKVVFLKIREKPRTNELFRNKDDKNHHTGKSLIEELPIDIIKSVPLDYMHLICLGVVRKLMHLWLKGPIAPFKISPTMREELSSKLEKISLNFGNDF
ncbi:unnamed protein product, partial [Allacma fusca]